MAIKVDTNGGSNARLPRRAVFDIQHETAILQHLAAKDCRVVPPVLNYGLSKNGNNYLVIPYYDLSLADYMKQYLSGISEKHAKEILLGMFEVLKQVHKRGVIHRDIKPANFMVKPDGSLVLIDFGMATYYMHNAKHVAAERLEPGEFIGSRRYASINVHNGFVPSRRDDYISAAYIYVAARWPEYMYPSGVPINWVEKKQLHNLPVECRPLFEYLYSVAFMESVELDKIIKF